MRIIATTVALLLAQAAGAQSAAPTSDSKRDQLDGFFDQTVADGLFRGVVIVQEAGEVIFERCHGDAEADVRQTTANSAFYLASLSKQFTAAAIMLLAERDELSYDDTLALHFPEYPDWAESITIRHLLTNTSGLGNYLQADLEQDGLTNNTVVTHLGLLEPEFPAGTQYLYSNSGYLLLARIVERVSKTSFREFTASQIFEPLGMTTAVFYDETKPAISERAFGYDRFGRPSDSPMLTNGAGGMYASARDLLQWCRAILDATLLPQEALDDALTGATLNDGSVSPYGFGWHIHDRESGKSIHHTGSLAGYRHFAFVGLSEKRVIIMLTNGGDAFPLPAMATAVTNILGGKPATTPKRALTDHLFAFARTNPDALRGEALRILREERSAFRVSEADLNDLGYAFLEMARIAAATDTFAAAAAAYPDSANVYDSYGEALMRGGNYELAAANYRKSLELDPQNENAKEMLKRLEKLNAR